MEEAKAKEIFEALYKDVNGKALSLEGRESMGLSSKSYVYGEILFDSFVKILQYANPPKGGTFCDCGSGTGKAVMIAHLLFDFEKCVGIELVDPLYNASAKVLKRYERDYRPQLAADVGDRKVIMHHASFLTCDFSNVDLIFMNATCFTDDLLEALEQRLNGMKVGSQVITTSKSLRSPQFQMYHQQAYDFSWGIGTEFYHRKIS